MSNSFLCWEVAPLLIFQCLFQPTQLPLSVWASLVLILKSCFFLFFPSSLQLFFPSASSLSSSLLWASLRRLFNSAFSALSLKISRVWESWPWSELILKFNRSSQHSQAILHDCLFYEKLQRYHLKNQKGFHFDNPTFWSKYGDDSSHVYSHRQGGCKSGWSSPTGSCAGFHCTALMIQQCRLFSLYLRPFVSFLSAQ